MTWNPAKKGPVKKNRVNGSFTMSPSPVPYRQGSKELIVHLLTSNVGKLRLSINRDQGSMICKLPTLLRESIYLRSLIQTINYLTLYCLRIAGGRLTNGRLIKSPSDSLNSNLAHLTGDDLARDFPWPTTRDTPTFIDKTRTTTITLYTTITVI